MLPKAKPKGFSKNSSPQESAHDIFQPISTIPASSQNIDGGSQ